MPEKYSFDFCSKALTKHFILFSFYYFKVAKLGCIIELLITDRG